MKKTFIFLYVIFSSFTSFSQTIWFAGFNQARSLDATDSKFGHYVYRFTLISLDTNWIDVSASWNYNIALKNDSTLWSWGYGTRGGLGFIDTNFTPFPRKIESDLKWISLSTGVEFNVALKSDSTLWSWGSNTVGQLGDGTYLDKNTPIRINSEKDWKKIATTGLTSFALKNNGTLWSWGANPYGELGISNNLTYLTIPTQIDSDSDWIDLSTGAYHVFALKKDSSWWAWGSNSSGQLGDSLNLKNHYFPQKINFPIKFKKIICGYENTLALDFNNKLWGWGYNFKNFLSSINDKNIFSPIRIFEQDSIQKVFNNFRSDYPSSAFLIKNDGSLWCWGSNDYFRLGIGDKFFLVKKPLQISNEKDWFKIATSWKHSLALRSTNAKVSIGKIVIPDTTVELSNSVCLPISVNFQKVTPANAYKGTFTARFVYNPFVFSFDSKLNNEKYGYQVKDSDDKQVLIITSDSIMFEKETKATIYLCLKTYLADTLISDIRADDLDFTGFGRASLDTGTINFVGCGLNLRRIKFFKATEFITKNNVINDKFEIDIKTEESGEFVVELINSIGMKIKEIKWDNDGNDKSLNLNFSEYAQGCYFINLRSPIYSKTIKVLKL